MNGAITVPPGVTLAGASGGTPHSEHPIGTVLLAFGGRGQPDGQSVFYTAQVGPNVELFQILLDGRTTQLTKTPAGTLHYHPQPSPDGQWLLYGSKRDGVRQLFVMRLADRAEQRITDLSVGRGAMWPHWQPATGDQR